MRYTNLHKVQSLELELLCPFTRKNSERLNELLSEGFQEFGASGLLYTKKDILERLPDESTTIFEYRDIIAKHLSRKVIQVNYFVRLTRNGKISKWSYRTSIWKKDDENNWKMDFHQGTTCNKRIS